MRILHIMASQGNGGAEVYSTDVVKSLQGPSFEQVIVMHPKASRASELSHAGLSVDTKVLSFPLRPVQKMRMRALIREFQPQIIHCWMRRAASLVPRDAAENAEIIGWYGDYEEYRHFSHCTRFVGVTKDIVRHMIESGIAPDRATYIQTFPSIDEGEALDRATLRTPKDAPLLLSLSRLHPVKGLDTLLKALVRLPQCYLWIAGDGPIRRDLEELANRLGVNDRVRFLGWRTDRGSLLRAATICVLPSRYEPFGTVILEAWSLRKPFVACASEGPSAYIRDFQNGLLVPKNDSIRLADAIASILSDPKLSDRIVTEGYREYESAYTCTHVSQLWSQFYTNLQMKDTAHCPTRGA